MTTRLFTADIEADGLLEDASKIWCASFTELSAKNQVLQSFTLTDYDEIKAMFTNPDHILVMHNGYSYDAAVVEKVLDVKVKAEIFDTLWYSWYLYPKALRHGLEAHGEDLGIAKPEIDDWENLELEDYIHRCEEDVKIQTALWLQMYKHFKLLYDNPKSIFHCIRHLNFKAKVRAMQEGEGWKLKVDSAQELSELLQDKYDEATQQLEANMPKVPVYAVKKRPSKPFKANGDLSAHGQKWVNIVEANVSPDVYDRAVDYDKEIKIITKYKEPNSGSPAQIKAWLNSLGWVPTSFKHKRDKETNEVKMIPQVKNPDTEELCESIVMMCEDNPELKYLEEYSVLKHRIGVVNGLLRDVDEDGFVQATANGITNTLRLRHKVCVNIPSLRKPWGKEIRSLFIASFENLELCGSDMSSLEDRTKQHYMWKHDPEYVKEMQAEGFDPHLDMAIFANLMTEEDSNWYKNASEEDSHTARYKSLGKIRHGGKSTNYSATYGAKGPTIARAAGVSEELGQKLYDGYWERNWSLTAIADECVVVQSRGMKWLYNPVAKIWYFLKAEKDRFSTLNQGTGTYAFDRWIYYILEARPQINAQFHDEGIFELKKGNREAMTKILKDAIKKVNDELKLNRDLDCDVQFGNNYAEIH